jgi:hypothetical protein
MRRVLFLFLGTLTLHCSSPKKSEGNNLQSTDSIADSLPVQKVIGGSIDLAKAKQKIKENRTKIPNMAGHLKEFRTFTQSLTKFDLYTISTTANYLTEFLPKANQTDRDSTFLYFLRTFYRVVNNLTDSLNIKYPATIKKLEEGKVDAETQNFKEYLGLFGAGLFMTEGMFYVDVEPDYFLGIFGKQVSKGLNDYLIQRKQELTEGFSEDAGLMITFDQVYERVLKWEKLITENPNFIMVDNSHQFYETYLETLLTGMDNSRVFDFENEKLIPAVKKLYESVIMSGPNTKSTEIIKGYYNLLAESDFKYSTKVDEYLKKNGLNSMLGVQPHSR